MGSLGHGGGDEKRKILQSTMPPTINRRENPSTEMAYYPCADNVGEGRPWLLMRARISYTHTLGAVAVRVADIRRGSFIDETASVVNREWVAAE